MFNHFNEKLLSKISRFEKDGDKIVEIITSTYEKRVILTKEILQKQRDAIADSKAEVEDKIAKINVLE